LASLGLDNVGVMLPTLFQVRVADVRAGWTYGHPGGARIGERRVAQERCDALAAERRWDERMGDLKHGRRARGRVRLVLELGDSDGAVGGVVG